MSILLQGLPIILFNDYVLSVLFSTTMTADVKPNISSVKHSYVTKSNALKQSMYGTSSIREVYGLSKRNSIHSNGNTHRIRSAAFVDQGWQNGKDQSPSHVSYTKFRPVTSHPTTFSLVSLYKQQSFAESRNSQAASKLPTILNNRPSTHHGRTTRDLKPFANPVYSATGPSSGRKYAPQSQHSMSRMLAGQQPNEQHKTESLTIGTAWNAAHESILASGHALFHESPHSSPVHSTVKSQTVSFDYKNLPNRSTINYVPFYEVRGRGDGASVVDIPSIDVEGKKIEKTIGNPAAKRHQQPQTNTPFSIKANPPATSSSPVEESKESRIAKEEEQKAKDPNGNEAATNSLVSSFLRPNKNKTVVETVPSPAKVEKKVRFSGTVTTNKISEEPSYTEELIHSLHKSFKQHNYLNTTHRTVSSTFGAIDLREVDLKREEAASTEASTPATGEEDEHGFVTPIMKVVVTKRETPAGAENQEPIHSSPRDPPQVFTPQQITMSASKILQSHDKGTVSQLDNRPLTTAEVIRKGTQATQRASTAGYSRSKEAIARVVKLVPKRQTVVMPSFTKQPAGSGRNFPQHSKNKFAVTTTANSPAFSASVHGNNFNQPTKEVKFKKPSLSSKENLRSRLLANRGSNQYFGKMENRQSRQSRQSVDEQKKTIEEELAATPLIALPTTENVSQVAMLSPRLFTDFQPIPSMPDHINFCDPRKTELILHWLEDVNKKRNIESRLRRVGLSK